jgi:penicillin-binding protein 2
LRGLPNIETCNRLLPFRVTEARTSLDVRFASCQHEIIPARTWIKIPALRPTKGPSRVSRYHSPYTTKRAPSRLPILLGLAVALLLGVGLGLAASGGLPSLPSSLTNDKTPTHEVAAASDQSPTARPTRSPRATHTAVPETGDPTETVASTAENDPTQPAADTATAAAQAPTDAPAATIEPTQTAPPEPTAEIESPGDASDRFAALWTAGDYVGLYDMLSTDSKSVLAQQDFADRFGAIATEIGLVSTTVTTTGSPDLNLQVPIDVVYETGTVGQIKEDKSIQLVREDDGWKVTWNPNLIFNKLGDGCVSFAVESVRRGSILDRNGTPLAYDGTASVIGVIPGQFQDEAAELKSLSKLVGMSVDDIKALYADADPTWFVPIKQFPKEVDDATKSALTNIPGAALRSQTSRIYPLGEKAAHITGYVTRVTQEDLDNDPTGELAGIDWIGRAGIESGANDLLTGTPGGRVMVVDCDTRAERTVIASRKATQPQDVILSVDADFQSKVFDALGDKVAGSSVIIDPRTGGVLALASVPSYDPNWFVSGMSGDDSKYINDDDKRPLLDRAAEAAYPTGSIFKVITMAAALHDLDYTGDTQIDCPQEFSLPGTDQVWRDWTYEEGLGPQGMLTLHTGLVNSCNTVFYQVGAALDEGNEEWLPDMAKAFGLGAPTGIPYFPEVAGTVPSPEWKLDAMNDYWARGDAVNMAIGQGFVEATPLQMANAYTAIANGGTLLQPFIVEYIKKADGSQEKVGKRTKIRKLPLDSDQVAEIQSALRDQASNTWGAGSARLFKDWSWPLAGKTGTAQNQATVEQTPHSWFAAFGPYGNTATIASIVMIESSGEGITYAAPRTATIYQYYLTTKLMDQET